MSPPGRRDESTSPRVPSAVRWRAETTEAVGRPVVAGGVALVPAADGLYAFDAHTGDRLWGHGGERDRPDGAAVAEGVAYAIMRDDPATVAIPLDDGSVLWRATGCTPATRPAAVGARSGVGRDAPVVRRVHRRLRARRPAGRLFVGTTGDEAYQLLATADGAVPIRRRKLPGTVHALTATHRSVFAATFDGGWFRLRAGTRAGRTEWHAAGAPTVTESLVCAGGTLVGVGDSLRALALGGDAGVGPSRLGTERRPYDPAPRAVAVADGAVFAVADDVGGAPGIVVLE